MTNPTVKVTFNLMDRETRTGDVRRDFDAVDTKGRRFGACATLVEADCVANEMNCPVWAAESWERRRSEERVEGHYFGYDPHALRDGKFYGSSHRTQWFATAEARDAAVEKYLRNAEKGALKNKLRAA